MRVHTKNLLPYLFYRLQKFVNREHKITDIDWSQTKGDKIPGIIVSSKRQNVSWER